MTGGAVKAQQLIDNRRYDEVEWILAVNAELNEAHERAVRERDQSQQEALRLRDHLWALIEDIERNLTDPTQIEEFLGYARDALEEDR